MKRMLSLTVTALAIYLVLLLLMFLMQRQLLFLPDRTVTVTPDLYQMEWEDVRMTASDGIWLNGWYIPNETSSHVLLFSHGNAGNISHRVELLEMLNRFGFATFIYDYRGYGESEGRPDEEGLYRDVRAAWDYLTKNRGYRPEQIILYGRSLGGAVSAHLAMETSPGLLLLDSAFTGLRNLAGEIYPFVPAGLVRYRFDTIGYLDSVTSPVLVMHSPEDEIIGFHHGEALFEAASEPKRMVRLMGGHNDNLFRTGERYGEEIRDFLDEIATSRDSEHIH